MREVSASNIDLVSDFFPRYSRFCSLSDSSIRIYESDDMERIMGISLENSFERLDE